MYNGSIIVARILNNDKHKEYEDEQIEHLMCDCCEPPITQYMYKGTGSNLVQPTMVDTSYYKTTEELDKALEEAHEKDMAKVYEETIKYRKKLIRELEEVDKYLNKSKPLNGCKRSISHEWYKFCGETDMGQTVPILCEECDPINGYKLKGK